MKKRSLALLLLFPLFAACGGQAGPAAAKGPRTVQYAVEVEVVAGRALDYTIEATGSVEAFEVIQVTARVAGAVERVLFREGDEVTQGQVLVEIEPERYRLEHELAIAAMSRAKAQADDAEAGLKRRVEAVAKSPNVFTPEEIETWRTRVAVATAEWKEESLNVETALLNKTYASPVAPAAGIIQSRGVQTGQYVQPGTVIATMIRRDPMLVRFTVPERDAAVLNVDQQVTFRVANVERPLRAAIFHVAASAEGASRLVTVTAQVHAEDAPLARPGSFAQVTAVVASRSDAPTIPEMAVRPSAEGFIAWVVEDGVARKRILRLGLRTADGRVEVRDGLTPGETLVVRGGEALREGASVVIPGASRAGGTP